MQISAEFIGSKLYAGDIKGNWFVTTSRGCYSTTREPFVGLSSVGASLLPQGAAGGNLVAYKEIGPHELQWTIAANSQHGLEHGTVWFNADDLIVRAQDRSYRSGHHGTAQATIVTLAYPKALPARVPDRLPLPACKE
jgi:hypothetical protein